MLSAEEGLTIYHEATGRWPQDVVRVDKDTLMIETDVFGDESIGFGYVSMFVRRNGKGWYLFHDQDGEEIPQCLEVGRHGLQRGVRDFALLLHRKYEGEAKDRNKARKERLVAQVRRSKKR